MAHSPCTLSSPRSRNWRKPRACFDYSEDRLGQAFTQPVATAPAALTKLAPPCRPARPLGRAAGSGMRLAVKLATGGDVSVDVTAVKFGQILL